jgi:hypothetical protein
MRLLTAIVLGTSICAVSAFNAPATAQQCQQHCFRDCSSGRCCTRCVTRCYRPPTYTPPPQYYAPPYQSAGIDIDPGVALIALAFLCGIVAIIGGALSQSSNTDVVLNNTAQWRDHTEDTRAATNDTRSEIAAIDEAIESQASAANERGRARADDLWRDLQGDPHG